MTNITSRLTTLINEKPVDQQDLDQAALFTLDAFANILAGTKSEPGRRLLSWANENGIFGPSGFNAGSGRIAFLLGSLCHILEVDDLHRQSVVHPGCITVPAIWAITETRTGKTLGQAALTAALHGFEAAIRLGNAVGPAHYRIWHNTATCGPFGSAFAAGTLLELDLNQLVDALGNAGTQSSGLWEFLETGAMSKHIHAGRASESGLLSAELAKHGLTGAPKIIEGLRGFFKAMCPDGDPEKILSDPEKPWMLHETSIKPWPSCRHTHPAIDAAQQIRKQMRQESISLEKIETVQISTYDAALALCNCQAPQTLYEAKFSIQHCVAAALAHDIVNFDSFDTPALNQLAELRNRTEVRLAGKYQEAYPVHWGSCVTVSLSNGKLITQEKKSAKGDPESPLTKDEIISKAVSLMEYAGLADPESFIDEILQMSSDKPVPKFPVQVFAG